MRLSRKVLLRIEQKIVYRGFMRWRTCSHGREEPQMKKFILTQIWVLDILESVKSCLTNFNQKSWWKHHPTRFDPIRCTFELVFANVQHVVIINSFELVCIRVRRTFALVSAKKVQSHIITSSPAVYCSCELVFSCRSLKTRVTIDIH